MLKHAMNEYLNEWGGVCVKAATTSHMLKVEEVYDNPHFSKTRCKCVMEQKEGS